MFYLNSILVLQNIVIISSNNNDNSTLCQKKMYCIIFVDFECFSSGIYNQLIYCLICCCFSFISEKKKDPGIPNSLPFKEEILHEAEARKKRVNNHVIFFICKLLHFNLLFWNLWANLNVNWIMRFNIALVIS